jgi:uncharacterized membrane protein
MAELVNLIAVGIAVVCIVLVVGSRDRIRSLDFRLTLVERRIREGQAEGTATPPATPDLRTEHDSSIVPEHFPPQVASKPASADRAPPPQLPPPEPASLPAAAAATRARPSLEERFGTQWVVWAGGIAVACGGFFMLRLSIEQGWFGPGVRVPLGALLALLLIAAGEWARRKELNTGIARIDNAHIPSILTAAGTTIAYADIWAAYALYNFLAPGTAFVLLGIVALGTLAAALLHGPTLAGLGLVGAYITPAVVSIGQPNYWTLYVYLMVVSGAALALARVRLWRWLAVTAVAFGVLWTLPGLGDYRVDWLTPHNFHVVAGYVLVAILLVSSLLLGPEAEQGKIEPIASASLGAYLIASVVVVLTSAHAPPALMTFSLLVATTIAISWRSEAAVGALPAAALLTSIVFASWALQFNFVNLVAPSGLTAPAIPDPPRVDVTWHIVLGVLFAGMFGIVGFLAQGRSQTSLIPMVWSATAVFAPIVILIALYFRIANFDRSIPFAGLALLLAALFATATETLGKHAPRPGSAGSGAIFATGCVAALSLALSMALEKGWLTVGLALMVPGVAWISLQRPLPALRLLAALLVGLVLARVAWEPRIVGSVLQTTPIFNWILYGYGVPAAAFWLAGHLLRQRADDGPARMCDAAALLFGVLLVFLEIRHYITDGDVYRISSTLSEIALQVSAGLAITIGLEWQRQRTRSVIHDVGALIMAALTLMGIVFGLGFVGNPMLWPRPIGGVFFNLVLLGYAIPSLLAVVLALMTRELRPRGYSVAAAVVAVALALAYLTLEVRTLYHGPVLTDGSTTDAEQYTYSAAWLMFGVLLLALGYGLRAQSVRIASAAVVVLTVLKVFFVDMSDLNGLWQPLSVLGLGIVLLGIGWFYQRLLFPRHLHPSPTVT